MKVVKHSNLPVRLPLYQTLIVAIALDYWNAPQWLWGVMGLLFIFQWIYSLILLSQEKKVDIFNK